jgi:cell division protein FtsI/penicillin-binding protein 2
MLLPLILTLIFSGVALLVILVLAWGAWRHRNPPAAVEETPFQEAKNFGPTATNRWLRGLRVFLVLLLITVLGFHSYWVFKADSSDEFSRAKRNDARNRRLAEFSLKGWVFDRTGKLENALIRYRSDGGVITREYPLGAAAVHLTGYSDFIFGAGGMEYAYRDWLTESTSTYNELISPNPVGKDLKVSIDSGLQRDVYNLIQGTGRPSAAVVLLLPTNEVLAMASAPSFEPRAITDQATWERLTQQVQDAPGMSPFPLVNRALGTLVTGGPAGYYAPGSTFKTFIASVAIDLGVTKEVFTCREGGFTPPGSGRAIQDFGGHVHGQLGLEDAFKLSCNQYFCQLGLKIGKERLADYARRLQFSTSPDDKTIRATGLWEVLHGSPEQFDYIFSPPVTQMNLSSKATSHDVALQAIGQGYADLTPLYMALITSAATSADGAFVAPTFEADAPRKVLGQFISAASAARMREMMKMVVDGGTAAGAFAPLRGRITAGGKTGTADRVVPVYDRNGKLVFEVDEKGRREQKWEGVTDSWFVGFAPAENPKIAYAVVVERGGEGAKTAAPIAVKIIESASRLGYLSINPGQAPARPQRPPKNRSPQPIQTR